MFRLFLQLICLPGIVLAIGQTDPTGQWDWIKSYRGGFAGGWETPADRGYSMHMIIRNDSVFTYHDDTLMSADSLTSLIDQEYGTVIEMHVDTLIIKQTRVEGGPASYWKKATVTTTPEKPPILFLCSIINYAWGYRHEGWFIDSSGSIRDYSFTQADSMGYVGQADTLSSKIYNNLLAKSTQTGKMIARDTLLSMLALIEPASGGTVTISARCLDAGIYRYSCFMPGAGTPYAKEIFCYQMGDIGMCNSSSAAKAIARWLNSIDTMELNICAPPDSCLEITTATIASLERENTAMIAMYGKAVNVRLAKSGTVIIRAYTLRGELLAKPFTLFLPVGGHRIDLTCIVSGIQSKKPIVLEISTDNGIRLATGTVIVSHDR